MPTTYFLLTSRFSKKRYISLQKNVKCSVKNSKTWEYKFEKWRKICKKLFTNVQKFIAEQKSK